MHRPVRSQLISQLCNSEQISELALLYFALIEHEEM